MLWLKFSTLSGN